MVKQSVIAGGKIVYTWPEANFWEQLSIGLQLFKGPNQVAVIVDPGSGAIELSRAQNRASETIKICRSQILGRLETFRTLVSDNDPDFVNLHLKQ